MEVKFLASAGLQILAATREKRGESAPFAVAAQSSITSRIIRLLGLNELLSLHASLADALTAVKAQNPVPNLNFNRIGPRARCVLLRGSCQRRLEGRAGLPVESLSAICRSC
jgi:hypothetical protein